jgi:hypothetical protein
MQVEIIDVHCTRGVKKKYSNVGLFDFCSKNNDKKSHPVIYSLALKIVRSTSGSSQV